MIDGPSLMEQDELDRQARERARELRNIIDFGHEVESFLGGRIGQRIMADSEREVLSLMESLVECDPDTEGGRLAARGIRRRIDILNHWQQAFAGYLNDARDAENQYIEGEVTGDDPEH